MPSALIMLVNKTAIAVFVFSSIIKPICCSMFFLSVYDVIEYGRNQFLSDIFYKNTIHKSVVDVS